MIKSIKTAISKSLYDEIKKEKSRLELKEKRKIKSKKRKITMVIASHKIARGIR